MSYSDFLTPRADVLSEDGIEGIIDLANLQDSQKRKLEARPTDFLELTYPTADVRRVIQTLHRRFSGDRDAPGLFLFEGLKGSGKSHLLLLVYHLFQNRSSAQSWLDRCQLSCAVPQEAVVVINKFTDMPLHSVWDFIFTRLTGKSPEQRGLQPGLEEVKAALGDRSLVLILDELEQGIRVISDSAIQAQNIAFLQMLSEWSHRETQVTLFASIYSDLVEPGSTLKRVDPFRIRFEHAADKARVVLHRLFENHRDLDPRTFRSVVDSYLGAWRRHQAVRSDELAARLTDSYPFSPDILEIVLDRVPARGGFQNVRGALGFLARLVNLTHQQADLITPAHANLIDPEVAIRLQDLDSSGDLIARARDNMRELSSYPLIAGLGATAMLYTLSGTGRDRGATREHLVRAVVTPSTDINEFEKALLALQRYGSYFHVQEGRYFFDREENADAKVEYRSLPISEDRARERVMGLWRDELFREPQSAVVFSAVEQTREELEQREKGRLRFVLGPRRLTQPERHQLYYGLSERNQVILLEPGDARFDVLLNRDVLKWGQRVLAAGDLLSTTQEAARKAEYERISREDCRNILDALRRAGLIFVRVDRYGSGPAEDVFEEESLGNAVTREEVVNRLSQEIFPVQLLAEHMGQQRDEWRGRSVKDIDRDYRSILGYPVPTHQNSVFRAIRQLCKDGRVGVRHPRGDFSNQDPELTESELATATLDAPFERPRPVPPTPRPTPPPGPGPQPPGPGPGPEPPVPTPGETVEEISIIAQTSPGVLRQELAARLQPYGDVTISRVRFTIFLESAAGDLSALPQSLRGSLSGPGSLTADISIAKEGVGSKGDVEQLAERLPNIAGAFYDARLEMVIPPPAEGAD